MKKTSAFSPTRVSMAVAVVCVGISMPAFAQMDTKMTGRVHYDARYFNNGLSGSQDRDYGSVADTFEIRRARIGFTGNYNKQIQYEGVANGVGSSTNIIDTAFINYGYNSAANIRVGRFKQPFSLEENTSSNNIDFMERSYVNQVIPGKKLGAMLHGANQSGFTYAASIYQNDFRELSNTDGSGTMGALRLTTNLAKFANLDGDSQPVLHLGYGLVSGSYEILPVTSGNTSKAPDTKTRATVIGFNDENRGLSNAYRLQIGGDLLGTGGGYNAVANHTVNVQNDMQGLELAVTHGPFKFQGEVADSKYNASTTRYNGTTASAIGTATLSANVKTQYMSVLFNITGEDFSKTYSKGSFGGIKPKSEFMKDYGGVVGNGTGAWQVGYRVSKYQVSIGQAASQDVSDSNADTTYYVNSGDGLGVTTSQNSRYQNSPSATTHTLAVNWILNSNARVMFNFSRTNFSSPVEVLDSSFDTTTTNKEDIFSIRTQFNF
jgi:phosphate-selective porin OprO/OprP